MKTVAVIADKGGVGKSTVSIHLGVAAGLRGLNAVVLGCDPQACSEAWFDIRNRGKDEPIAPAVLTTQAVRVPSIVEKAKVNDVDLLVIDIGANSENAASYAVRAADLVLVLTTPRMFDMRGIDEMAAKAVEQKKPYFVLINRVLRGPYLKDAQAYLEAKGFKYAPIHLNERVPYANCLNNGMAVMEFDPDSDPSKDFMKFFDWVLDTVGLKPTTTTPVQQAVESAAASALSV